MSMHDTNLSTLLRRTSRLTLVLEVLRGLLFGTAALLAVGLLAVLLDAVLALGSWALVTVDVLWLGLAAVAALYATWRLFRNLYHPQRVALLIERRLDIGDNRLINALELRESARPAASAQLQKKVIDDGESLALTISSVDAADFGRLSRAGAAIAVATFLVLVSFLAAPRLFGMVLPRYFDPHGDHPPFTLVRFDVRTEPERIYFGQPATITARLAGHEEIVQANVVFVEGELRQTQPMVRSVDGDFILPVDRAGDSREFYIETPQGRSRRYDFTVLKVPFFEKAHVGYRFPSYTGWPPSQHVLDVRGIRALVGTEATLTAQSNVPLKAGLLELRHARGEQKPPHSVSTVTLSPHSNDPTTVSGSFPLEFDGQYRLRLVGVNGAESLDELKGPLTAAPDRLPRVSIVEPSPHVVVVEGWKMPVLVQAIDDIGVERIELLCSVNGWGPWPTELQRELPQPNLARAGYEFDLSTLGARAGDVITYYATASDTHPSGEHVADSPTYVIQVISQEEYLAYARQRYRMDELIAEWDGFREDLAQLKSEREELLKELEELEELQQKLENGEELSDAERERLDDLMEKLEKFAERAKQLAEALNKRLEQPELYDVEQPYREMLSELSEQLKEQASNAGKAAESLSAANSQPDDPDARKQACEAWRQFANKNEPFDGETAEQMDAGHQDLEQLRMAEDILAAAEQLRAVILQQRELADRMAQFRDRPQLSPAEQQRARQLADQQERLKEALEAAAKQLEQSADTARDDLPKMSSGAVGICRSIGESGVIDDQQNAAETARNGQGQQAFQSAETAAEKLEALLSEMCDSSGAAGELSSELDGPLKLPKPSLERTLEQLAQGRQLPGLGSRPGSKPGFQGIGRSNFGQSMGRMMIVGPYQPSGDESNAQLMFSGRQGHGRSMFGDRGDGVGAGETVDPGPQVGRQVTTGNLRGVPVGYREQAEAYFRRIAEEE